LRVRGRWRLRHTNSTMVLLKKRIPGASAALFERFVRRACGAVKLKGTVNVVITSNPEMRSLNRRFRGKDAATDVLSFPAVPGLPGGLVGDLAISGEIAADNAKQLGHTVEDEIKILILHGALHLAGYDHETDRGKMARKEAELRVGLKLPMTLIARTDQQAGAASTRRRKP
jgi:probable rRNA maturation factor